MTAGRQELGASACGDQAGAFRGRSLSWQQRGPRGAHTVELHGSGPYASATAHGDTLASRVATAASGLMRLSQASATPAAGAPLQCERSSPSATGRPETDVRAPSLARIAAPFTVQSAIYWLHRQERNRDIRAQPSGFEDFSRAHVNLHRKIMALFEKLGDKQSDLDNVYPNVYAAEVAYSELRRQESRDSQSGAVVRAALLRNGLDAIDNEAFSKVYELASKYRIAAPSFRDTPQPAAWKVAYKEVFDIAGGRYKGVDMHTRGDAIDCRMRIYAMLHGSWTSFGAKKLCETGLQCGRPAAEYYYDELLRLADEATVAQNSLQYTAICRRLNEVEEATYAELRQLKEKCHQSGAGAAQSTPQTTVRGVPKAVAMVVAPAGYLYLANGLCKSQGTDFVARITREPNPAVVEPAGGLDPAARSPAAVADAEMRGISRTGH